MQSLFCIKLGGSVITDKSKPYTFNEKAIRSIAKILKQIKTPLLISHGAGSFAHTSAKKYGGNNGYKSKLGIAKVCLDADEINSLVMKIFLEEKLPAISFGPRSFLITKKGQLEKYFFDPILQTLSQGLIPVIYGDVIFDEVQKTTIFSGETTLSILAKYLQKNDFDIPQIIQLSDVDGVMDQQKKIIPEITSKNWPEIKKTIINNNAVDVTGGMMHKIENALELTKHKIQTKIVKGKNINNLKHIVNEESFIGTLIK